MSLGAFALVASEFMPVSLLTSIAADLHVSEGSAGQAITVSGFFAVITSLGITSLTRNLDRKILLMGLTLLMILAASITALAPNYAAFIAARALVGIAIGGFWSMTAATAMRLVPLHQLPRALAVVNGGAALATVIAAPLGSFMDTLLGWRWAFFSIVPIAALAFVWKGISLPSMQATVRNASTGSLGLLRRPVIALGMLAVSLFFMGQFTLFTYLRPFLESITGLNAPAISLMLLAIGIAGFIGTGVIGRFLKYGLNRLLISLPIVLALIAVALITAGRQAPATTLLLVFWGFIATAAPVAWWAWLAHSLPDDSEAGGGLMVAVIQLAIGCGSSVGGLLFDHRGYQTSFAASATILALSSVLAVCAARATVSPVSDIDESSSSV